MNKSELIDAIAKSTKKTKSSIEDTLNALTVAIQSTFAVEARAARIGRNPATGKELKIPAKKVLKFKVGSKLKEAVAGSKSKKK
jgi:DNA-binding protein HU-beta